MVMHVTRRPRTPFVLLATALAWLVACSGGDSDSKTSSSGTTPSSSGSTSGGSSSSSSSSSSSGGGSCTGDVTLCTIGSLSDAQQQDFCSTLYAAIDDPAGTTYACKSLDRSITLNDKQTCVAQRAPAGCSIKVSQVLDCYKAAKKDACTALADSGACHFFFPPPAGCGG